MKKSNIFSPKKTVVSNTLKLKNKNSLVEYNSSSDEEVDERPPRKVTAASKNGGAPTTAKSTQVIPSVDKSLSKSFLMWENSANVCWLDASMALLVHNKTLAESLDEKSPTQIVGITKYYYQAVSILNDYTDERHIDIRIQAAKDLLKTVQESTLKYLQPILKYKEGEPDSAFCSLFNLITEDKSVKDFFDLEFTWVQVCKKCKNHRVKKHKKPIVTLPRVAIFQACSPIAIYQCPVCKEPDQVMMLNFRTLPQCLLFHFESGAGKGELQCNDFEVDGRTYRMTGVMTLEKGKESNVNHFITFIRDPSSDTWLECNDLNDEIMCFCMIPPFIELEDVYIIMYEATDGLGTVTNSSLALDKCGLGEESVSGGADIPLIDLADDTENSSNEKGHRACNQPKEGSRRSKNVGLLETCEDCTSPSFSETLNVDPTTETKSCVDNKGTKDLADTANKISEISKEDLKVTDESEIFMRNLNLCQKNKPEKSLQNRYTSPLDQIKNLHIVTKINKFEVINPPKINTSPNLIEASNEVNDIPNRTASGSPKSEGQMLAKTYKKLLQTLDEAVLKQEVPLAMCTESDKNEVPKTELSNELAAKEQKSEINKSKPLMSKVCKDFDYQVPHNSDCKKPKLEKTAKKSHSECTIEITAKVPRRYTHKTQPKQRKQEQKVSNSKIVHAGFKKESKQGQVNIKKKVLSNLIVTTTEMQLLSNRDSMSSAEIAVKGLMGKMNKTQTKLEPKKSSSDNGDSKKESDRGNVDEETQELTTLDLPNKKKQSCKSGRISPHKKKEKNSSEQAVQPKKQCLSVGVPDSIAVEMERPVLVDAKKHISVEADNLVPEKVKHKREKSNYTSPKIFSDKMEQTAFANSPKKTYSKRNLEAARPKSPLQRKHQTNLEIMIDKNLQSNQGDPIRHLHSSNDCRHATIDELLPPTINDNSQIDSKMMECKEGCDCDALCMDETFDVVADGVLNSIFGFFGLRKH